MTTGTPRRLQNCNISNHRIGHGDRQYKESTVKAQGGYNPDSGMLAGFTSSDGTIEFYNRIAALLDPAFTVLDVGAGRGSWFYVDNSDYRRKLRTIKGKVKEYVCADIDEVVMANPTSDRNVVIQNGRVPLEDGSVDIIVSDFVLEHVVDVAAFRSEIARLLKPGGYFCARTPHSMHYVSLLARLIRNTRHARLLPFVQPARQSEDVFPTAYKLNRLRQVRAAFPDWEDYTYIYTPEPRYYFGSRLVYRLLSVVHALAPRALTGNLFIFLRKRPCQRPYLSHSRDVEPHDVEQYATSGAQMRQM